MSNNLITKADINKYKNESDLYKLLDCNKNSTQNEIEKSYRKLSLKWHPDKQNLDDDTLKDEALNIYKKLVEAKEILCDESQRKIYDTDGLEGIKNNFNSEAHTNMMNDFFNQMFGQNIQKSPVQNINIVEEFTLEELYNGKEYNKEIERTSLCNTCNGYGTEDGQNHQCNECNGTGIQIKVLRSGNMIQQIQQVCSVCNGMKMNVNIKKCKKCNGTRLYKEKKTINIKIPKGFYEGLSIELKNEGNELFNEYKKDNKTHTSIILTIKEKKHKMFVRRFQLKNYRVNCNPENLKLQLNISLLESLTGFTKEIQFLNGKKITIIHEDIIKHNDILMVSNYGMPKLNSNNLYGNLYIEFNVEYPKEFNNTIKRKLWQVLNNTNYKEDINLDIIDNKVKLNKLNYYEENNEKEDLENEQMNGNACNQQ
jgi:DnaJ-class molecular chaperone